MCVIGLQLGFQLSLDCVNGCVLSAGNLISYHCRQSSIPNHPSVNRLFQLIMCLRNVCHIIMCFSQMFSGHLFLF